MVEPRRVPTREPKTRFNTAILQSLVDLKDDGNHTRAAKRVGISQPSMSALLGGKQPKSRTVYLIAEAYGVTPGYLMGGGPVSPDDTFSQGVYHAVRRVRQSLDEIEAQMQQRDPLFIRPAPRDADVNQRGIMPLDLHRVAEQPVDYEPISSKQPKTIAKKKGGKKKSR